MDDLTEDSLLGGRIRLLQPKKGYRVSSDAVLLAALAPASAHALELGAGYGQVALCLALRQPACRVMAVELLPEVADLARRNAALNQLETRITVESADIRRLKLELDFDLVLANPPYRKPEGHTLSPDQRQNYANFELDGVTLADWAATAARHLGPDGRALFIQPFARQTDLQQALMAAGLGRQKILHFLPHAGEPPGRVVICAQKGEGPSQIISNPLILHEADGRWRTEVEEALREGASLAGYWN